MAELEALIFDVDGTISDTERDGHRIAFNRAFAEAGLEWDWSVELYHKILTVAGGKERILYYWELFHPDFKPEVDRWQWAAQLHRAKTRHYRDLIAGGIIPLRPGVRRLLQEARAEGIRLAIATTSAPDNVMALLEATLGKESPAWFEVIAAGDVVPAKKPAPDIYHYVLQQLQLSPAHCLVLEDSRQGLLAATAAGLKTVITCSVYTQDENFPEAALVLNHLGEPDQPFRVLAGKVGPAPYFTINLARQL
ncbi:MAG: HAD family hydrolase [Leptolyngbyaceae cyanobacterium]